MGDGLICGIDLGSGSDIMVVAKHHAGRLEIVDVYEEGRARRRARDMHVGISGLIAWGETFGLDRRKRKRAMRKAREAAKREWDRNEKGLIGG